MNTSAREKSVKELLLGKTWDYLNDNFHKFKQPIKIKISLALCQKDMPQELTGDFSHKIVELALIRKEIPSEEPNVEPVNRIAEYLIGSPSSTSNIKYTE